MWACCSCRRALSRASAARWARRSATFWERRVVLAGGVQDPHRERPEHRPASLQRDDHHRRGTRAPDQLQLLGIVAQLLERLRGHGVEHHHLAGPDGDGGGMLAVGINRVQRPHPLEALLDLGVAGDRGAAQDRAVTATEVHGGRVREVGHGEPGHVLDAVGGVPALLEQQARLGQQVRGVALAREADAQVGHPHRDARPGGHDEQAHEVVAVAEVLVPEAREDREADSRRSRPGPFRRSRPAWTRSRAGRPAC